MPSLPGGACEWGKAARIGQAHVGDSDPSLQAQALTDAADKLRQRAEAAAEKKDKKKESDRFAIGYSMFVEKAFTPFFDKLKITQPKGPRMGKRGALISPSSRSSLN